MSWIFHIDPQVNCIFVKYYGAFELEQIKSAADEVSIHPNYRSGMNFLRDNREQRISEDVSFKSLSNAAHQVMDEFDQERGTCKTAIVAGDAQSYAKIHQYVLAGRLSKSPVERKAFRDIEMAKEWLGIPKGYEICYPTPGETTNNALKGHNP